jgi:hypothetical protein
MLDNKMTPSDTSTEMLGIYADWLEDQGYCTKELREELELAITNSWYYEYYVGGGVGSVVGGVGSIVGGVGVDGFGVSVGVVGGVVGGGVAGVVAGVVGGGVAGVVAGVVGFGSGVGSGG